jgi:cyclomaltodextrinase / maltogenic alpha-amylase / neopullulanase
MTQRALLCLVPLLACTITAEADVKVKKLEGGAEFQVVFRHQPVIACERVTVAGSFNGWNKSTHALKDDDGDGTFELALPLPRGIHHYKFVINDSVWQHDQDNPRTESDGHSGFNSVLELGTEKPSAPGEVGDGQINGDEVIHDPAQLAYACAVDKGKRLVLRIHVLAGDVQTVRVAVTPRPANGTKGVVTARRIATWEGRDVYEARIHWGRSPSKVRYAFRLGDGDATLRFPSARQRFTLSMREAGRFRTPDWVRDAVFYQIFPDRFADGDPARNATLPQRPEGQPWDVNDRYVDAWGSKPSHFNFMGGDLAGITKKADYLASLGVNTIYLNPIFKAASNHRYDASDYETIDPALGTLDDFHTMKEALAKRGIRVILDSVFNHTGDSHYAFKDAETKGPESRYSDWYFFDGGFPVVKTPKPNYKAWWGFSSLPQLNTRNPEVIKHLMGVGTQWLKEGASGWRLDVPNEVEAVNPEFWPEFRRQIHAQDPDAYLVGEIWTDAREWLQGNRFDAVMNYPVRSAVLEFMVKGGIDAKGFVDALSKQLATYPEPALRVQFNLLGSHDTARILHLAKGDARKVKLAMSFLFAYKGAPVVYYGDEVGVTGGKDPECRKTFPWDALPDPSTLDHMRQLGAIRTAEAALRRGDIRFLETEGRLCAFVRESEHGDRGRSVVCVLNAGDGSVECSLDAGVTGTPKELLTGKPVTLDGGRLRLTLGPYEAAFIAVE